MNKAIFIDKDGTLIHDIPYNVDVSLIEFTDGAAEALQLWKEQGYLIVIISNQSGIARNYFTEEDIAGVKEFIKLQLALHHIALDGFYYCPHHPQGINRKYAIECDCRKPAAGLILKAAKDLNVDIASSWMIGDILHDVEAGKRAGCRTVLINNGNETEWLYNQYRTPDYEASDLKDAAGFITRNSLKQEDEWR